MKNEGDAGQSDLCHLAVEAREDKKISNKRITFFFCQVSLCLVPMLNYKRKLETSTCILLHVLM